VRWIVACAFVLGLASPARADHSEDELIAVIVAQPRAPEAELFATELLDRLNRQGRRQELVAWVDRMLATPQLLYGREDLANNLHAIQLQAQLLAAMQLHQRASQTNTADDWRMAALSYLRAAAVLRVAGKNQSRDRAIEALTNAAVCWRSAGDPLAALQTYASIVDPLIVPHVRATIPLAWLDRLLTD
jgi:hypothetical protein